MAFCHVLCNRVFQPPHQLRGVGIYSHGCKQGCFQPPGRVSPTRARVPDSAIIRQGRWYSSTMVAKYTRGEVRASQPCGWNEGYEPAILRGGGSADCPGLPPPTWKGGPAALGLGPALLGTRWAADVAERTFRSFLKPALQKGIQRLATFSQDHNLPIAPYKHRSASERM